MKTIYSAVITRLREKVPAIKWIDLNTGQLDVQTDRPAVLLPCALISVAITRAKNITDNIQDCEAQVTVRMAFDRLGRTSAEVDPAVRDQALQPYDIIDDTYAALQGFETQYFSALARTSQAPENGRNGMFIYRLTFKTDFEDNTADTE